MNYIFFLIPIFLIGTIPYSFAEIEKGLNYNDELIGINPDGSQIRKWSSVPERILSDGEYVDFRFINGAEFLSVETGHGSVKLDKNTCSFDFYKKGIIEGQPLFTDSIIVKMANDGTETWNEITQITNAVCEASGNENQLVAKKFVPGVGLVEYKYINTGSSWKTQLEATNLSSQTNKKFGFTQTVDLNRDTINYGGGQKNLDNYAGTTFDRTWLENNEGKVIDFLNDVSFDFDLGFNNLKSIAVYDTGLNKSKLSFNYLYNAQILLPNETIIIDPTWGYTAGTFGRVITTAAVGVACGAVSSKATGGGYIQLPNSGVNDQCLITFTEFDITTIPTSTITDVSIRWDQSAVSNALTCSFTSLESQPSVSTAQTIWDDVTDGGGTTFVSGNTQCQTASNDKVLDLGTSANTDLQNNLAVDWWGYGMYFGTLTRDGTQRSVDMVSAGEQAELQVTYILASPPYAVTDLVSTSTTNTSVSLDWTAPYAGGGGQTIIGYQINRTTPWGLPTVLVNDTGTTTTDYISTGLLFGTDYSFRVSAWTNNTNGHPFNNATGNILNVTTTTTTYSTPPTNLIASAQSSTQIDLDWVAPTGMQNINGYRIQRETPINTGWATIVSNTTNTNAYYNNTGLTTNIIYNYRVYAMNGSGISTVSNTYDMTTFHLPDAVDDLSGTATDLSTIELTWSTPTSYAPEIQGYRINGTTPTGTPVDILNSNTGTTATTATAFNLLIGQEYSFRVSPITVHGMNASGNIWNGSTIQTFVIGNLSSPDITNDDDFSIFFDRTDVNASAIQLDVTYPNSYNLSCDFSYKYARINQTYSSLTSVPNGTDNQVATFTLINATGDLVQVRCWDVLTGDESKYVITITDFPFLEQVRSLRNGDYGTYFQIGAFDGVMLIIIFLGMIGLNRTTPIVGIVFVVITTLVMSYFELINYPVIMYPALIMMIVWAFVTTRKDD